MGVFQIEAAASVNTLVGAQLVRKTVAGGEFRR